ncbi:MAG TPA: hypothetical protein VNN20_00675 [Thermodesulfobacteriota bacterium]|nr:hypothetical protein [Thermodesulfobacteriota bacterium]
MMRERSKVESDRGVVKFDSKALHDMVMKRLERYVSREGEKTETFSIAVGEENGTEETEE